MCILSWCKAIFLPAEIEYNYSNVFFALNFVYCIYSIILIWLMPKNFTLSSKQKISAGILMLGLIINIFSKSKKIFKYFVTFSSLDCY